MRGRIAVAFMLAILVGLIAGAQFRSGGYRGRPAEYATRGDFDGSFQFCRIVFRRAPFGDGDGWNVDYPRADENLSTGMSELTKTSVGFTEEARPSTCSSIRGAPSFSGVRSS